MNTIPQTTIESARAFLKANPGIYDLLKAGAHITIRMPKAKNHPVVFFMDEEQSMVADLDMKELLEEIRKHSTR